MGTMLYLLARAVIALIQALPLLWVVRLGRAGGALAYALDARHRRVVQRNLELCFGQEMSPAELNALAREHLRRLGENYACAVKTAAMTAEQLRPHLEFRGVEKILAHRVGAELQSLIAAIGHFGNFELYARFGQYYPTMRCATTYRGLRQPALDRLLRTLRERSGCLYFERRTESAALKAAMKPTGFMVGFLVDQHAGDHGLRVPFFGHDCSTSAAPAVFALRYGCPLHPAFCFRTRPGYWVFEVGDEIPTHLAGNARTTAEITTDINRAYEAAIRRDPANWFWVHNRWKPPPPRPIPAPVPAAL